MQAMSQAPHYDEYGLLLDPMDWTQDLADHLAHEEGIEELTPQHWQFINSLRDYYQEFQVPPPASLICHNLNMHSGCGHRLFHSCLSAWRIAGLPDPGEEAKSYMSAE